MHTKAHKKHENTKLRNILDKQKTSKVKRNIHKKHCGTNTIKFVFCEPSADEHGAYHKCSLNSR